MNLLNSTSQKLTYHKAHWVDNWTAFSIQNGSETEAFLNEYETNRLWISNYSNMFSPIKYQKIWGENPFIVSNLERVKPSLLTFTNQFRSNEFFGVGCLFTVFIFVIFFSRRKNKRTEMNKQTKSTFLLFNFVHLRWN